MSSPADQHEPAAGSGGAGAPPEADESNRAEADLTREYASGEISVRWYASRCIHAAACIKALPQVFDPRRRPWIDASAANADAIAAAVLECPTGALHFERADGGEEPTPPAVRIVAVPNGPYFVTGPVEVTTPDGGMIRKDSRLALCRCGRSGHLPFCDNTHRATGFRTEPETRRP